MKYSTVVVGAFAMTVVAQLEQLPQCAQLCITNMLGQAQSLGCQPADIACLCGNEDFRFGIRDCSNAVCNAQDAATAIAFGTQYCASAAAASSAVSSVISSAVQSATSAAAGAGNAATTTDTTLVTSVTGTATETATSGGSESPSAVSTQALLSTVTNDDGSVATSTVGSTTLFGVGGVVSSATDAAGSASSALSSVATAAESSASEALGSATASASSAIASITSALAGASSSIRSSVNQATSSAGSVATTSSAAGAAQQTMAVGILGVAGLAAMLL